MNGFLENSIVVDPFSIKKYSKIHPVRLGFTVYARALELYAGIVFEKRYLKYLQPETEAVTGYDSKNTAVTPNQMSAIIHFLKKSCNQCEAEAIVEVGSYRGVTTTLMASVTKKTVYRGPVHRIWRR